MYIGLKKVTMINTIFNMAFYFFIFFEFGKRINFIEIIIAPCVFILYYIFNVFSLEKGKYTFEDFLNSFMVNLLLITFVFLTKITNHQVIFFTITFIFQNILKVLLYYFFVKSRNVLIIGNNNEASELEKILRDRDLYNVIGIVPKEKLDEIKDIVENKNVRKIIITEQITDNSFIKFILKEKLKGIQVYSYLNFYEKIEEKIPVKSIDEKWLLFGNGYDLLHNEFNIRIKRVFDIVMALTIGTIALPFMIISAIITKIESKGSIIFKQKRIGLGNKTFLIYKFRSMKQHNENEHSKYAQKNDGRITRFGKIMRKTRIDELPQLWNVIKGDMSFVGPRAEWDKLCYGYMEQIPFYTIRHTIKPGLTGWAQVRYPYGASVEDAQQKLQYDLYYIKHHTLAMDVVIILKTVKTVLFRKGQ